MSTKKLHIDLNLRKKSCSEPFDVKQQSAGIFIEGFANKATVDRGAEIIATDAWELENFKRNPIILFNHGMDTLGGTPVGKAIEIKATDQGLYLKVKMSNSQAPGIKMVRDLVEERILKAFSVGFNPKETDSVDIEGKSVRRIKKAELFEVSVVGVPMNQDSLFELSEKSLTTKSFHQLKGEILKAKGAKVAIEIEEKLGACASRRDAMAHVAKSQGLSLHVLLDMLAGDKPIPKAVAEAFVTAIKAVDLKTTLEEALAALNDGSDEATVLADLSGKLSGDAADETTTTEIEIESAQDSQTESADAGKESGTTAEATGQEPDPEATEDAPENAQRKADFQSCVNDKLPKLLQEGKPQDEAVAAAIAMCQAEGKCQLTAASKAQVFSKFFKQFDAKEAFVMPKIKGLVEFKADPVPEDEQPPEDPNAPPPEEGTPDPEMDQELQKNFLLQYAEFVNAASKKMDADPSLEIEDAVNQVLKETVTDPAARQKVDAAIIQFAKDGFSNAKELDKFLEDETNKVVEEIPFTDAELDDDPAQKGEAGSGITGHRTPSKAKPGGNQRIANLTPKDIQTVGLQSDSDRTGRVAKSLGIMAGVFGGMALGALAAGARTEARDIAAVAVYLGAGALGAKIRQKIQGARAKRRRAGKSVDGTTQADQAPTTAVMTADAADNFGSPFLEAAKQTNVLLGALINEIQKLSSKMDGISQQSSVNLENNPGPKDQAESSDSSKNNADVEANAAKTLATLDMRLKSLGY